MDGGGVESDDEDMTKMEQKVGQERVGRAWLVVGGALRSMVWCARCDIVR